MEKIKTFIDELNQELASIQFGQKPPELYDPITYILGLGGKRMRPLLALLAYIIKKEDYQKILRPALSVEVFHNFTLMHDDIMDNAPLRRGKPTVHEKWDANIAILSGDTMMVKAYDLLLDIEGPQLPTVLSKFNRCAVEVCEGQQLDMNFEQRITVSQEEYIEMIRLKTAVLLGYSLELGGILGGMTGEDTRFLKEFGINIGIGFQLKDDLLDVYGDKEKFGKQVGGDIVSNKKTFLLINALLLAEGQTKLALNEWLSKEDFEVEEKVEAVTNLYDQLGIKQLTEEKINQYFTRGFEALSKVDASAKKIQPLRQFAEYLINREK